MSILGHTNANFLRNDSSTSAPRNCAQQIGSPSTPGYFMSVLKVLEAGVFSNNTGWRVRMCQSVNCGKQDFTRVLGFFNRIYYDPIQMALYFYDGSTRRALAVSQVDHSNNAIQVDTWNEGHSLPPEAQWQWSVYGSNSSQGSFRNIATGKFLTTNFYVPQNNVPQDMRQWDSKRVVDSSEVFFSEGCI